MDFHQIIRQFTVHILGRGKKRRDNGKPKGTRSRRCQHCIETQSSLQPPGEGRRCIGLADWQTGRSAIEKRLATVGWAKGTCSSPPSSETYYRRTIEKTVGEIPLPTSRQPLDGFNSRCFPPRLAACRRASNRWPVCLKGSERSSLLPPSSPANIGRVAVCSWAWGIDCDCDWERGPGHWGTRTRSGQP